MSYNANFPVSADVLANPTALTNRDDAGFELHGVISRMQDILEALEAKVGIGASTPPATAAVLRRTATGASAWGPIAAADVPANALNASSIFAGGTGNRVLRTTDGTNAVWGRVGTLDATLGFWSAYGVPADFAGPGPSGIVGSALSVTMAGANPLLFGVALSSVYNRTANATLTVTIWEGSGAITTVGAISINTSDLRGIAKTYATTATAGPHTYFLSWQVTAGTVTAADFSFWAMEIPH